MHFEQTIQGLLDPDVCFGRREATVLNVELMNTRYDPSALHWGYARAHNLLNQVFGPRSRQGHAEETIRGLGCGRADHGRSFLPKMHDHFWLHIFLPHLLSKGRLAGVGVQIIPTRVKAKIQDMP
jgi:hypothetical protein